MISRAGARNRAANCIQQRRPVETTQRDSRSVDRSRFPGSIVETVIAWQTAGPSKRPRLPTSVDHREQRPTDPWASKNPRNADEGRHGRDEQVPDLAEPGRDVPSNPRSKFANRHSKP